MATRRLQIVLDLDTGAYSGRLNTAGTQMRKFSGDVARASKDVGGLGNAFDRLGATAHRPIAQLRDYVMVLGNIHFALLNVQNLMIGWISSLVKQSAEVERLTVLMKGLSTATNEAGRSSEATASLNTLFNMARKNGIAVTSLTDAFVKMKSAGLDPLKGSLQSLTDAVSYFGGSGETFHRASIAIQQMAGKGVISMEELRQQLGEAVPTAIRDMARAMGMSMKDFTKAVSDGKVQAKPALELMFREFELMYAGAGSRMANTLNGQLETFKTNVTELSTYFTGLVTGMTPEFQRQAEEARKAFEAGKISAAEYQEAITPKAGMFGNIVESLKQINEAMRSNEARQAMAALGSGINTVLTGISALVQFVVRWRTEFGIALTAIVAGFAAVKATQMINWMVRMGIDGAAALKSIATSAGQVYAPMQNLVAATDRYVASLTRAENVKALRAARAGQEVTQSNQLVASLTQELNAHNRKTTAINNQIVARSKQLTQEVQALAQAKQWYATSVAMGQGEALALAQVDAAQKKVNQSKAALTRLRAAERASAAAATATNAALTNAVNAQSAAQVRMNAVTAAGSTALGFYSMAARVAATSISFLGKAVQFALGPIGQIIIALGMAAWQAGLFASKADKAAAAAARLAQGIATLDDVKDLSARRDQVRDELKAAKAQRDGTASPLGIKTPGSFGNYLGSGMTLDQFIKDRETKLAKSDGLVQRANTFFQASTGRDAAQGYFAQRDVFRNRQGQAYQNDVRDIEKKYGAGTPQANALIKQRREKYRNSQKNYDELGLATIENMARNATGDQKVRYEALAAAIREASGASLDMAESDDKLATAAIGAGKGVENKTKKLTEAEKATQKFESIMEQNVGTIGSMRDELDGGNGAFAKFQAQLTSTDKYAHMTKQQIEALGESFKEIDRLAKEIDFKNVFKRLSDDAKAAQRDAEALWASLRNGTLKKDMRNIQIDSQYRDQIENEGDPIKKAMLIGEREKVKDGAAQSDAAQVIQDWKDQAEEINISLMNENDAREANFQRDVQRMRDSVDWKRMTDQQKAEAEAALQGKIDAMRKKNERESEGSTLRMMRQWYKLGENMDAALSGALESFVDNLAEGKASFADFAKEIIKALIKVILKAIIAYAILSALGMTEGQSLGSFIKGGLGDFAKGMGGGGTKPSEMGKQPTVQGTPPIAGYATGGKGPPDYHTGGWIGMPSLKPGEVPMIGMEGEVVLTKAHQRFYADAMSGGGSPNVAVNIINNSGTAVTAEQSEPRMDGKNLIVDVVVEAMNKQGPLRDNLQRMLKS